MPTPTRRPIKAAIGILMLCSMFLGGCPELKDEAISTVENATRQFVDRALSDLFDGLRGNSF